MNKPIIQILAIAALFTISPIPGEAQQKSPSKALRHVVMFGWADGTPQQDIDRIVSAFSELPSKIREINGFEWGINNSPEGLNQGLTHCFFLTFKSEKDRDSYLVHPAHQAFVKALVPAPAKVTVLDYWVKK